MRRCTAATVLALRAFHALSVPQAHSRANWVKDQPTQCNLFSRASPWRGMEPCAGAYPTAAEPPRNQATPAWHSTGFSRNRCWVPMPASGHGPERCRNIQRLRSAPAPLRRFLGVYRRPSQVAIEVRAAAGEQLGEQDDLAGVLGEVLDNVVDGLKHGDVVPLNIDMVPQPAGRQLSRIRAASSTAVSRPSSSSFPKRRRVR